MLKKIAACLLVVILLIGLLGLVGCFCHKDPSPTAASASSDPRAPESLRLPEIQAALRTTKEIDRHQITLCSLNNKMDQVITETMESIPDVGLATSASNQLLAVSTIDHLIESTRELRMMAREILEQKDEYLATLRSFEKPIGRAPAELRRAAELFEQFSVEAEFDAFRDDYLEMSRLFLALAERYEVQREQFQLEFNEESYLETMIYLERGALMLDRFESALIVARTADEFPDAMRHLENIRTFIRTFEAFRTKIRRVNKMLDESNVPSTEDADTLLQEDDDQTPGRTARNAFSAASALSA